MSKRRRHQETAVAEIDPAMLGEGSIPTALGNEPAAVTAAEPAAPAPAEAPAPELSAEAAAERVAWLNGKIDAHSAALTANGAETAARQRALWDHTDREAAAIAKLQSEGRRLFSARRAFEVERDRLVKK